MEPLVHGAAAAQAGRVARAVAQAAWELNRSRMCAEKKSFKFCVQHSLPRDGLQWVFYVALCPLLG